MKDRQNEETIKLNSYQQKEVLYDILDHNGNAIPIDAEVNLEFTKKFRRTYENRRL